MEDGGSAGGGRCSPVRRTARWYAPEQGSGAGTGLGDPGRRPGSRRGGAGAARVLDVAALRPNRRGRSSGRNRHRFHRRRPSARWRGRDARDPGREARRRLEMPVRMKLPILPVYYYHDHFTEMLFFVSETYGPVLNERHRAFVETFKTLSKDAQCLLIRMITRRGRVFRHGAFRYAEIADALSALEELCNCNLVRALIEGDYADFIVCHAKET